MIRISKSDEADRDNDSAERQISISGTTDSVALAKSLINMSLDLHKSKMDDQAREEREGGGSSSGGGRYFYLIHRSDPSNPELRIRQKLQENS